MPRSVEYLVIIFWCFLLHMFPASVAEQGILRNGTMDVWFKRAVETSAVGAGGTQWELDDTTAKTSTHDKNFANWLITRTITLQNFTYIHMEIHGEIDHCHGVAKCDFRVYVFKQEGEPQIRNQDTKVQKRKYFLENFSPVYSISNSSTTKKHKFNVRHTKGDITFGIESTGATGFLTQMKVFIYYCKGTVYNGLTLLKTLSPANGSIQRELGCTQNSSPATTNGTSAKAFCNADGTWTVDENARCLCHKGFETSLASGCQSCPEHHYQPKSSNTSCLQCPDQSTNDVTRTRCRCIRHRYRLPWQQNFTRAPCYALPAKVSNLKGKLEQQNVEAMILTWSPPVETQAELNRSLRYDVECYRCSTPMKENCTQACPSVSYLPRKRSLNRHSVRVTGIKPGQVYGFKVFSRNVLSEAVNRSLWNFEFKIFAVNAESKNKPRFNHVQYLLMGCVGASLVFIVCIVLVCVIRKRRKFKKNCHDCGISLATMEQKLYIDPTIYDDPEYALHNFAHEVDPGSLSLERVIGGGEFGDVYKGVLTLQDGSVLVVAAKTLKQNIGLKGQRDFFLEASAMGQFDDPNVIHLEGIITKVEPRMIITEFMANGSLNSFLKKNDGQLSNLELIEMAKDVASGMAYLATIGFVHRDLAARNILVTEKMVCKVADFGLSRELETTDSSMGEYFTTGGKIPVRWTAPEAIKFRKFSTASDVWSYGILLWEIMTFAQRPYWNWDNFQVMERVEDGFRLPPPQRCPPVVHKLMLQCWHSVRGDRPGFDRIVEVIDEWIASPESLDVVNDDQEDRPPEPGVDFSASVRDWLHDIKLSLYVPHFMGAGYEALSELAGLADNDLKDMGITLIGHRNKILRTIRKLPITNIHVA